MIDGLGSVLVGASLLAIKATSATGSPASWLLQKQQMVLADLRLTHGYAHAIAAESEP
ncbi:hypothetical protein NAV33_06185 [Pseudomonas stutzeri]|uniref:hypothetical protein n=1 Tax=Stutzerimonas stutzeri TaxID=316 RepID=UPI00210E8AFE|nr:hypothetical protein [Stutzerimonas stutzeri]MCQ4311481.1 hypothetical protein [Stutzerimonas stutzeri]